MNNLPNISNTSQPPAKANQKAAQGFSHPQAKQPDTRQSAQKQPEGKTPGNSSFIGAGNGSSAAQKNTSHISNASDTKATADKLTDAQATEPFAVLLARQIDGADVLTLDFAQVAIAINEKAASEDATATLNDPQDPAAIDPATTLAAMLMQLPQEKRSSATDDATGNSTANNGKTSGLDIATFNATIRSESTTAKQDPAKPDLVKLDSAKPDSTKPDLAKPDLAKPDSIKSDSIKPGLEIAGMVSAAPEKIDMPAIMSDKQVIADVLTRNAVKQTEFSPGLSQLGVTNITQTPISPAISAAMPNLQSNNGATNAPQGIATPLGASGWADDFSQKISWISTQRNQIAELHLNPPDLGPLNVVLKISDNQATALFTSPHTAVRDAIENALPKLRETLADNGITLGNTTVSDQPPRDRGREESLGQGTGAQSQHEPPGGAKLTGLSTSTTQGNPVRRHLGMVDTFA